MGEARALEKKVDRLEEIMMQLAYQAMKTEMALERLSESQKKTEEALRDLKEAQKKTGEAQRRAEEAQERFWQGLEELKEAQRKFWEGLKELKETQKKTEEELRDLKETQKKSEEWWNKRWGELARKMGTMAEDILIPGFPKIAEALGFEVTEMAARVRIGPKGRWKEYDAVIWAEKDGEEVVFVAEVKSKLRAEDFNDFKNKLEFFADHARGVKGKRIIPVMATFNPEPDLVNLATKRKVLLVGMSGAYVEAFNPEVVN